MNKQELKNIVGFVDDLKKVSRDVGLVCDSKVASDLSLHIDIAVDTIFNLTNEILILQQKLDVTTGSKETTKTGISKVV